MRELGDETNKDHTNGWREAIEKQWKRREMWALIKLAAIGAALFTIGAFLGVLILLLR